MSTVFPRIVVHAPIYETEAMVHAPKVSPKSTFFPPQKNRAISYISACTCRGPKFCYHCRGCTYTKSGKWQIILCFFGPKIAKIRDFSRHFAKNGPFLAIFGFT